MQGGDISNESPSCLLVIFEGLLGIPPQEAQRRGWKRLKKPSPSESISQYTINGLLLGQIRRAPNPVEIVTFLGQDYVTPIELRLEEHHALVRRVWNTTPQELARIHITMPDVSAIYDPDPIRAFATYGTRGRHLLPENAPQLGQH